MKKTILLLLILMTAAFPVDAGKTKKGYMNIDGMKREYLIYLPTDIPAEAPLVVLFHGYGGKAGDISEYLLDVAEREKFAVCMPQGSLDPQGTPCWNLHYDCQKGMIADDVAFIRALVHKMQKKYHLSVQNTFCMGASNGGDMSYCLAHSAPELFTAIASVVGVLTGKVKDSGYEMPLPFLQMHGTGDEISWWSGDMANVAGYGIWYPVPEAVAYMASKSGCKTSVTKELAEVGGMKTTLTKYLDGNPSKKDGVPQEVHFYQVEGGDHNWWRTKDMHIGEEIWNFFSKYLR